MSDERLRDLERRCRASGSSEDEAAWLLARVQAGESSRERVALAAFLGHEPARCAVPVAGRLGDLTELSAWPALVIDRACLAVVQLLVPVWASAFPDDDRLRRAVSNADEWFLAPGTLPAQGRVRDLEAAEHDAARQLADGYDSAPARAAVAVDYTLAGILRGGTGLEVVARFSEDALAGGSAAIAQGERRQRARARLLEAVTIELVPWALGYSDPVRDRVEARRRP